MKKSIILMIFLFSIILNSQEYFPINTGVKTKPNTTVAFTNATIYVTPTQIINKGTLLIKDGKVLNVGKAITIPKGTEIINLEGKYVYPSFIDIYASFGISKPKRKPNSRNSKPQYDAERKGYYWNDHIRPDTNPINLFKFDNKKAKELLKAGFGIVNTHLQDGIVRGNGLLISLNSNPSSSNRILDNKSAQYLSFQKSNQSKQAYPNSLMGAMALLRQVYYDAQWNAKGLSKNNDLALEAFNKNKNLVQIFDAGGKQNDLRADKIGDQFGIQYTIVGGGDEYEDIDEIKATNATYIIPINFRKAYDVSNPFFASKIDVSDMRKWNQEPSNLSVLQKNGIRFSITTHKLKSIADFNKNIQKAIKFGLNKTAALEALTTVPASILRKSNEIGKLQKGHYANFLITSGEIFEPKTITYENWVQGSKNVINEMNIKDLTGNYTLSLNNNKYLLSITGKGRKLASSIKKDSLKINSKISYISNWLTITMNETKDSSKFTRLVARINDVSDNLSGASVDADGKKSTWRAIKNPLEKKEIKKKKKEATKLSITPVTFPNTAFGFSKRAKQETILIKNATVWTSEKEGILQNTDVLLKDGKISKIGKNLRTGNAKVIDGTGKYLTAGIIDEHTHIAAVAINEAGHNSSAEVTIEDVINPDDIKIYRNLAGGVTTVQILHGSANPIGGRSAIIKLKWGETANNMLYKKSPKFIKFALGENVKQSNWGSNNTVRFPQTRMGVEQVYMDYFQRAKEYNDFKKTGKPYRKDIELETLAEILNKERFISCHSYVQSEINMLMKVAEKFNFKINTFTHILEGYKVADKMKQHGVGASTFSDWWAYKYEVNDAIPYNATILHNMGITVAINSDDAEMSRRLNQEAAKSIKYGGISEEEAWEFVTINPAKLLHIDDKVGSIRVGKDADLVLWNKNPLSIYAKAEKTIIDGIIYFDIQKDLELRKSVQKERNTLINMMLNEKIKGKAVQTPKKKASINFHCDTVLEY
ncbi:amidohydrolase family protein [Lutibacter sp.]|uniref:amidohydrolase family protein n=1 Tax=Lutibacter sp. TaxID=1925666 RepID=UPI0025BF28F5|nr:amidohydrolase family protein [Lutibacter sp.]MCF6167471.1 amidohydrolase family protein [Lutibacter sp.]